MINKNILFNMIDLINILLNRAEYYIGIVSEGVNVGDYALNYFR